MKGSIIFLVVLLAVVIIGGAVLILNSMQNRTALPSTGYATQPSSGYSSTPSSSPSSPSTTSTTPSSNPSSSSTSGIYNVAIQNFAFVPKTMTVDVGDTVKWTNMDSVAHTVTSNSGSELNSPNINSGQSYTHTFTTPGTYTYHCSIHPDMMGTIIVNAPSSSSTSSSSSSTSNSGGGGGGY